jgi:hypothetical protein
MKNRTRMTLITLMATLASLVLGAVPGVASAQATTCYGGEDVYQRGVAANAWTDWFYDTTSTRCHDLNVKITDQPANCSVFVDAWYYKPGTGWVDGAHDDFWFRPNQWVRPLTDLKDGVKVAARFYFRCSDASTRIHVAS